MKRGNAQNRIEDLERETEQISKRLSPWHAKTRMNSLRTQDTISKSDPLSETERQLLERLRGVSALNYEERRVLLALESREPLSLSESWELGRLTELRQQTRDLRRQVEMRTSPRSPASLRVYPNDELQVVLRESGLFVDDTCLGTTVVPDRSVVEKQFLEKNRATGS